MHSACRRDSYKGYLALGCAYLPRVVEEVQRAGGLRSIGIRPGDAVEKIGSIQVVLGVELGGDRRTLAAMRSGR
jgi:hypothetical protein